MRLIFGLIVPFNLSCEEKKFDSETEQVKIEKQLVEGDIIRTTGEILQCRHGKAL